MMWFGRNALAIACYAPLALAGLLLPYAAFPASAPDLDAPVAGVALVQALQAAALTWAGRQVWLRLRAVGTVRGGEPAGATQG